MNGWSANAKNADKLASGDVRVKMFDFNKPITGDVTVYAKWHYVYQPIKNLALVDVLSTMDKFSADEELDTTEKLTYDFNRDGKIDTQDLANWVNAQDAKYVVVSENNTSCDVNSDGTVDDKDVLAVAKSIVGEAQEKTDVNGDLMTNTDDLATVMRAAKYNIVNQAKENALVGDLNRDEIVNGLDSLILSKYLNGKIGLSDQAIINADTNNDADVDVNDFQVLAMFVKGLVKTLPYNYTNDNIDVNGDNIVDEQDVEAWKVLLEDYKTILKEIEDKLDVNHDGIVDNLDLSHFTNYLSLNYVNFMDAVVDFDGNKVTVREMMNEVLTKEKAHNFKISVTINGTQYLKSVSMDVLEGFILNLEQFSAGDKIDIYYSYQQGWTGSFWGQFDASWPANAQQSCTLNK